MTKSAAKFIRENSRRMLAIVLLFSMLLMSMPVVALPFVSAEGSAVSGSDVSSALTDDITDEQIVDEDDEKVPDEEGDPAPTETPSDSDAPGKETVSSASDITIDTAANMLGTMLMAAIPGGTVETEWKLYAKTNGPIGATLTFRGSSFELDTSSVLISSYVLETTSVTIGITVPEG